MYSYDSQKLKKIFGEILQQNLSVEGFTWLKDKASLSFNASQFNTNFVAVPRKTGKQNLQLSTQQLQSVSNIRPGLNIQDWTTDRLGRAWLILHLDSSDKEKYFRNIENLFPAAEINELVALYSSLPLFDYPEMWTARCSEGIRNNIADVLKTIMCNNPYPSENLNEAAWNQMVLKAFFTEKPIGEIVGLDKRANQKLAKTLSDYAHERWAAHRSVNPHLWRCVGPYIDEELISDLEKVLNTGTNIEREAAALALHSSKYLPAKQLIPEEFASAIEKGTLSWETVAAKMNDYVLQ
jgi:hypothetical protein